MRHIHQTALPQIGEGQERLSQANILIVGVGALGSTAAEILCRAGVGNITLCDFDIIEESNLQRQSLYTTVDIGRLKVEAAKEHLISIDPNCLVKTVEEPFSPDTSISEYDLVIDGTDSLDARLVLNDAALRHKKPLVIGTASGTAGMVYVVQGSPCWQCIVQGKTSTDGCESGVLGAITHAIASLQAAAAMRTLLTSPPQGLFELDVWEMQWRSIAVPQNPACDACKGRFRHETALRFCQGRSRLIARSPVPQVVDLEMIRKRNDVVKDYRTAVLVKLGEGTVLVHKHGAFEFTDVPEPAAKEFVKGILKM
jgi:molybdopterin-synthase adenylyltransferase